MESVPDATPHNQNRESPHAAQRIGKRTQNASDQSFRTAENTCRNAGKYPKNHLSPYQTTLRNVFRFLPGIFFRSFKKTCFYCDFFIKSKYFIFKILAFLLNTIHKLPL